MTKYLYIALFTSLGVLVSFLVHALVEIPVIHLLVSDFEKWNLGLSWGDWVFVHNVWSSILLALGLYVGFWQGRRFWRATYGKDKLRGGREAR